jgi:hypothetical protein
MQITFVTAEVTQQDRRLLERDCGCNRELTDPVKLPNSAPAVLSIVPGPT